MREQTLTFTLRTSQYPPLQSGLTLTPTQISSLMQQLLDGASMYQASRGIHAAAVSNVEYVILLAEDAGRHNALDKILGEVLLKGIRTECRILLSTGYISSKMLRKGTFMGIPFVVSRLLPTLLAIDATKRLGLIVNGYVRRSSCHLYTHPERLRRKMEPSAF